MQMKTTLSPMLSVRRGSQAIQFYEAAFGAEVVYRVDDDSGAVVAQLSASGAEFWVADESPEHGNFSPESLDGSTCRIVLVVEDPETVFKRAIAAGATEVWPVDHRHCWLIGRVVDPYGHHWEIGRPPS
ncbi:VOC family protein [Pseudolysobacter antarcticus]|uniref:VOC family protein n=2 Tax=Pseudolysobacter antarcticus TaxID=2511995 RepID=A0A411HNG7_9GAMM|nr:VOC family protein [Pseudolysobacter antarcticus]